MFFSIVCDLSPIVDLSTGDFPSETRSAFDGKSVADLKANVDMCCSLTPTVQTVKTCASLAQQFSDLAHEVSRSCDQLVLEQHLQHQVCKFMWFQIITPKLLLTFVLVVICKVRSIKKNVVISKNKSCLLCDKFAYLNKYVLYTEHYTATCLRACFLIKLII